MADARLYVCTDGRRSRGDLADFLDAVLAGGVDVIQLREKGLEAREELALLEVFAAAAERHGRLWSVNDRADLAAVSRAPVLHLGQDDLPAAAARRIVGDDVVIGRSSHSPAQFDAEIASLLSHAATTAGERPWFAIGGIDLSNLDEVIARGARRVVVVRAITEAADPGAAAAEFVTALRAHPLRT